MKNQQILMASPLVLTKMYETQRREMQTESYLPCVNWLLKNEIRQNWAKSFSVFYFDLIN